MGDWLNAAGLIHGIVLTLAAIGFFWFWIRTRFWLPKYVHWMAAGAMFIGLGLLWLVDADAAITRGQWAWLKEALLVLMFPAIVYVAFVFYGGQHAAYEARLTGTTVRCPHCGAGQGMPDTICSVCGQTISSTYDQAPQGRGEARGNAMSPDGRRR